MDLTALMNLTALMDLTVLMNLNLERSSWRTFSLFPDVGCLPLYKRRHGSPALAEGIERQTSTSLSRDHWEYSISWWTLLLTILADFDASELIMLWLVGSLLALFVLVRCLQSRIFRRFLSDVLLWVLPMKLFDELHRYRMLKTRPKRIILVRHGESEGNVDREIYASVPDPNLHLTPLGHSQSQNAGRNIRHLLLDRYAVARSGAGVKEMAHRSNPGRSERNKKTKGKRKNRIPEKSKSGRSTMSMTGSLTTLLCSWRKLVSWCTGEQKRKIRIDMYISPYTRTWETANGIVEGMKMEEESESERCAPVALEIKMYEDPRLREQDFGNFQNPEDMTDIFEDRWRYGRFFYRFPSGESGADVYDRVSLFLETLHRDFRDTADPVDEIILVTHGLTIRLFLMRYFHWSVRHFHAIDNPENAEIVVLEQNARTLAYELKSSLRRRSDAEPLSPSGVPKGKKRIRRSISTIIYGEH